MAWNESDLGLLPARIQKQVAQTATRTQTKKKRGNPEQNLVVKPTTDLCDMLGVWWVHIPPSHINKSNGQTLHLTAYKGYTGLPDIIMGKDGRSLMLECKAPGKKPTNKQAIALQELGGFWADNPINTEKAVMWVAGKANMFQYDSTRKIL